MLKYHVIGFGDPIVDVIGQVSYDFLENNSIKKGGRVLISSKDRELFINNDELRNKQLSTGGTTCNTIFSLSCLGGSAAVLGIMADDNEGNFFFDRFQENGIKVICKPQDVDLATSSCVIMVTPDAERTMNTYIGASQLSADKYINENNISESKLFYTEIYKLFNPVGVAEVQKGLRMAKENKITTAITLGDYTCVNALYDMLLSTIIPNVDIVLGNEFEIPALLKVDANDMELIKLEGHKFACKNNSILVMTMASRGVVIFDPNLESPVFIEALPVKKLVDATGAGDSFAAGFISGYVNNLDTFKCGILGTFIASRVISKVGATLDKVEDADFIKKINTDFNLSWKV